MGNCYSLYSKNLGMSGKMVWWSTEPNWSTKLGDLTECLKLTLVTPPTNFPSLLPRWSLLGRNTFFLHMKLHM